MFGKSASPEQARLLAAGWHGKPVVVLLDADAAEEAERVRRQVAALHPEQVIVVTLPDGLDPGSCPRDELWEFLRAEAARQGANLPATSRARHEDGVEPRGGCCHPRTDTPINHSHA